MCGRVQRTHFRSSHKSYVMSCKCCLPEVCTHRSTCFAENRRVERTCLRVGRAGRIKEMKTETKRGRQRGNLRQIKSRSITTLETALRAIRGQPAHSHRRNVLDSGSHCMFCIWTHSFAPVSSSTMAPSTKQKQLHLQTNKRSKKVSYRGKEKDATW